MTDLSNLNRQQIQEQLNSLGYEGTVKECAPIDLDQKGGKDLVCLVEKKGSSDVGGSSSIGTRTKSALFLYDDGQKINYSFSQKNTHPELDEGDQERRAKVVERFQSIFPETRVARQILMDPTPPQDNSANSTQKRVSASLLAGEPPNWWKKTVNFFTTPSSQQQIHEHQLSFLEEVQGTKDPFFLPALAQITKKDVRLGKGEYYDSTVFETVDQTLLSLVSAASTEDLTHLYQVTQERLAHLKEYWGKKAEGTGLTDFAYRHEERVANLLNTVDAELKKRFETSRDGNGASSDASPEYVATHYKYAALSFGRTVADVPSGFLHLIKESNAVNLLPRFGYSLVAGVLKAIYHIPGEVAGLVTAGTTGLNGGELGENLANTAMSLSVLKAVKGFLVGRVSLGELFRKSVEDEEVQKPKPKPKEEAPKTDKNVDKDLSQALRDLQDFAKQHSEASQAIAAKMKEAKIIAEDTSKSAQFRLEQIKRCINEARKIADEASKPAPSKSNGKPGKRTERKANYEARKKELADKEDGQSPEKAEEPTEPASAKSPRPVEKTALEQAIDNPPDALNESTLSELTDGRVITENASAFKALKKFYDKNKSLRATFWEGMKNMMEGKNVKKLEPREQNLWELKFNDHRVFYKRKDGKFEISDIKHRGNLGWSE